MHQPKMSSLKSEQLVIREESEIINTVVTYDIDLDIFTIAFVKDSQPLMKIKYIYKYIYIA